MKKILNQQNHGKTWIDYNLIEILLRPVAWRSKPRAWHLLICAQRMDHTSWCLVLGTWRFVFGVSCLAFKPHYKPEQVRLDEFEIRKELKCPIGQIGCGVTELTYGVPER